jgi:hypothetical protein
MRNLRSHWPIAAVLVCWPASWLDAQILTLPGPAAINSVRPGAPIGEEIFSLRYLVLEFLVPEFRISLIPNEIPILCEIRDSRPERETHGEADKC